MNIKDFIDELRNTDEYIVHIYTKGGCYRFHVLLSKMFNGCIPYINGTKDHIITRYGGRYYDINGEVSDPYGFIPLTKEDILAVEKWSFRKHNLLKLGECPSCEEYLTF